MSEIKTIYKVDDKEFLTLDGAEKYLESRMTDEQIKENTVDVLNRLMITLKDQNSNVAIEVRSKIEELVDYLQDEIDYDPYDSYYDSGC